MSRQIKARALDLWTEALGLEGGSMNDQTRMVLEFFLGGLVGMLAYRAQAAHRVREEDIVRALAPEVPRALMACIARAEGL